MRLYNSKILSILIPGMVFQSLITGGGFATGREIVEYCLQFGVKGFWVIAIMAVGFSLMFFFSAEIARTFKVFDYRSWSKIFLHSYWYLVDVLFVVMSTLVCAVVLSGASEIANNAIGIPAIYGLVFSTIFGSIVIAFGRDAVVLTKIFGAVVLFGGYALFAVFSITGGHVTVSEMAVPANDYMWLQKGIEYVSYNAVVLPACLYSFQYLETRKQVVLSAILTVLLVILPILFVSIAIVWSPSNVMQSPVPLHDAVASLNVGWLLVVYYFILIWTLFDTAVGLVYAIVERINSQVLERGFSPLSMVYRATITFSFLLASIFLSKIGIIDLIAKGYSSMAYGFMAVLLFPMFTIGIYKLFHHKKEHV